jgi:hypothetical protein
MNAIIENRLDSILVRHDLAYNGLEIRRTRKISGVSYGVYYNNGCQLIGSLEKCLAVFGDDIYNVKEHYKYGVYSSDPIMRVRRAGGVSWIHSDHTTRSGDFIPSNVDPDNDPVELPDYELPDLDEERLQETVSELLPAYGLTVADIIGIEDADKEIPDTDLIWRYSPVGLDAELPELSEPDQALYWLN